MEFPADIGRYLLTLQVTDILDIGIMVFLMYHLRLLVRSTKAASLLKGLFMFLAALVLSGLLQLNGINFILNRMVEVGVLALIILFQPEIRRILEEMGSRRFMAFFTHSEVASSMEQTISQTVLACTEMSQSRTGVLIVFEREILLDDMVRSGTVLDASVSSELLKNIFFVKAPMHDGAVIVRQGRVLAAGCMLPLSKNVNLQVVVHEAHGVCDDCETFLFLKRADEREARRACVDHDGVAVTDEAGGALGDGLLVLAENRAALDEGDVIIRVLVEHSTAVAAAQKVFAFELLEVTSDGFLCDAEELRKFGNVDFSLFIQLVHDFATTLDAQHDDSPL